MNFYKCNANCPYYEKCHPIGARSNGSQYNAAAIPHFLAEEVAEHVMCTFSQQNIRRKEEVFLTPKEEKEFNRGMSDIVEPSVN